MNKNRASKHIMPNNITGVDVKYIRRTSLFVAMIKITGILLIVFFAEAKRPDYVGPRDRFWRHHQTNKSIIIDGVEKYNIIQSCIQEGLSDNDIELMKLIPGDRSIGRKIIDDPENLFGNIVLVEIKNAMTPIHMKAVQTLAKCIREHVPSMYENRPMYLEFGLEKDPGLGGNNPTHLAPLLHIFLPEVVEDMFRVIQLAYDTAGWSQLTIRDELRNDNDGPDRINSHPKPSDLGFRASEHLTYTDFPSLADHTDGSATAYTLNYAFSEPEEYEGGYLYVQDMAGHKTYLKANKYSAFVFLGGNYVHGVTEITKGHREAFSTETWFNPDIPLGTTLWSSTPASMEQYILKCNELGQNRDNGPCNATFSDITANGVKVADNKIGNFKYQEDDEYYDEAYDGLEKHRRQLTELLSFDMELEFLPEEEEPFFLIPRELSSGEVFPLSYRETNEVVNDEAYAIGLPPELLVEFQKYVEKSGLLRIARRLIYEEGAYCHKKHCLYELEDNTTWGCMSTKWKKGDMIWIDPGNELCFETLISVLRRGNFDVVLDTVGKLFDLDGLMIQGVGPIFLSHFDHDPEYKQIHRDLPGAKGAFFNVVVPLYIPEGGASLYVGNDESALPIQMRYNVGTLLGAETRHGTGECDYRDNHDVRLSVAIYLADVNEENQELIASDSTSLWPSIGDTNWFESQTGRFWRSDGSRSMKNDEGRTPLHVKDFFKNCDSMDKILCMEDPTGFRLNCPKTCNLYFEDHLYYAYLGKQPIPSSNKADVPQDVISELVDWFRSEGGFFSEKISTTSVDKQTGEVVRGVFAGTSLKKNEEIIIVPADMQFSGRGMCGTTKRLVREYYNKDSSRFKPFLNYVFDSFEHHQLPQAWSEDGKKLFSILVGKELEPQNFGSNLFKYACGDSHDDEIYEIAWSIVVARGWNDVLVPVYDLVNHRNGRWKNIDQINSFHDDEDVTVIATRDIEPGEPLHLSYNECNDLDCLGIAYLYTLSSLVGDYGFVEQYPRRFTFKIFGDNLVFELDTSDDIEYELTWLDHYPSMTEINWLRGQLRRLENLEDPLNEGVVGLPKHEKSLIQDYYIALKIGLEQAILQTEDDEEPTENDLKTDDADFCSTDRMIYDDLREKPDNLDYNDYIALSADDKWAYQEREELDEAMSFYQDIKFDIFNDTKNKKSNTCLHLSLWLQTCSSFRPHYHEPLVHYPASFLDTVKRVLFLGGGDNMILHEVLKYPSIELVIGIELDQQVVRSSFKNFGAQPHFDRDVVQWWFGDASKTLRMLPQEYHGTFDLVLVDLQTYVVNSLMITTELNILDVALLFLRPDGILAQNEDFVTRNKEGFAQYTVDLEFHDVPVIGRQFINMGSDSLDFFHEKPKNHEIETVIFDPFSGNNHHLDSWCNFRKGDRFAAKKKEGINKFIQNKMIKSDGMTSTYGAMFILEIENVTLELVPSTNVLNSVSAALNNAGLSIISSTSLASNDNESEEFFILMKEGYLILRIWPQFNYCAIDFMVWKNFHKKDIVQAELMKALGGTTSTFAIVAGGMYGSETSENQVYSIDSGKASDANLEYSLDPASEKMEDLDYVLQEMIKLVQKKDPVIAVFCPTETKSCRAINALRKEGKNETRIFTITGCSGQIFDDNLPARMQACDDEIHAALTDIVLTNGKISGIVLDKKVEFEMVQIIYRIFSDPQNNKKMLENKYSIIIPDSDPYESWRKAFVERFRTEIVKYSAAHTAELSVLGPISRFKLNIFSRNDDNFYLHLQLAIEKCEKGTEVVIETHTVKDGILSYKPDNSPHKFVYDQDYQSKAADEQWKHQRPLGRQTISQFEVKIPPLPLFPDDEVLANLGNDFVYGEWYPLYVYGVNEDGTYNVGLEEPLHRQWLRKLENNEGMESSQFIVGDRILMQTEEESWQPGAVLKKVNNDTYSIQLNDEEGTILDVNQHKLLKLEEIPNTANKPKISLFQLKMSFRSILEMMENRSRKDTKQKEGIHLRVYDEVGDGCIITGSWSNGSATLLWDGRDHVDINVFICDSVDDNVYAGKFFGEAFVRKINSLGLTAQDEHPRGFGRVVNFKTDLQDNPHWIF